MKQKFFRSLADLRFAIAILLIIASFSISYSQNITINGYVDGLGMHDVKILKKLKTDNPELSNELMSLF